MATEPLEEEAPVLEVVALPPQQALDWRERWAHPLAVGLAAAAHLALLVMMLPADVESLGEEGLALEAVAVSMVDSIPTAYVPAVAAPDVPVEPTVTEEPLDSPPETPPEASRTEPPTPAHTSPLTLALPPDHQISDEALALPVEPPEPPPPREEPPPEKLSEEKPPEDKPPETIQHEARPQPPAPPPTPAVMPTVAAAQASPGVIAAYAREVSRVLASNPPRGRGYKGRVHIQFVIGVTGKPEVVTVSSSSGNAALDDRVIKAVAALSFPPPPATLSEKDRTMVLPFIFR